MQDKPMKEVPEFTGVLRAHLVNVPAVISQCSGIRIFGKRIKSLVFSTDVAIIKNCNADAVIAVYPFTPQPCLTQAIMEVADMPVLCGIGGGITTGKRVVKLAQDAEFRGAYGAVVNAPTKNETLRYLKENIDIPVVLTVVSEKTDIAARLVAGADILNVSGASQTARIVRAIRKEHPSVPIIATGGPNEQTILETIEAGANAITYTPPTNGELFSQLMRKYREQDDQE